MALRAPYTGMSSLSVGIWALPSGARAAPCYWVDVYVCKPSQNVDGQHEILLIYTIRIKKDVIHHKGCGFIHRGDKLALFLCENIIVSVFN